MKRLVLILCFLAASQSAGGTIIHVPSEQPTIQSGINAANGGDTILVADGRYYERISFLGKSITVSSQLIMDADSSHVYNTIIDADTLVIGASDTGSVVLFASDEDSTSHLIGLSIRNGTGSIGEWLFTPGGRVGGGILVVACGPTIRGCILDSCSAEFGSGLACVAAGYPAGFSDTIRVDNCTIWGETSNYSGILVCRRCQLKGDCRSAANEIHFVGNTHVDGNIFLGNTAYPYEQWGNGYAVIDSSDITGGISFAQGGRVDATNSSMESVVSGPMGGPRFYLTDCIIRGLVQDSDDGVAMIMRCTVGGVRAASMYGLIYADSCLITGESVVGDGGYVQFNNCTILKTVRCCYNTVEFNNCVMSMSGDTAVVTCSGYGSVTASCCDVFDFAPPNWLTETPTELDTANVYFQYPRFCDTTNADYHLAANSPCAPSNNDCGVLIGAYGVGCGDIYRKWYAAPGGDDVSGDGSESNPFGTIQHAVYTASPYDTVIALDGLYSENVHIPGSWIVVGSEFILDQDSSHIGNTIIDGGGGAWAVYFSPSDDSIPEFRGLTVSNADKGLYMVSVSPIIMDCVISDVIGPVQYGVDVLALPSYLIEPSIFNCHLINNSLHVSGGNSGHTHVSNCQIDGSVIAEGKSACEVENSTIGGVSQLAGFVALDSCTVTGDISGYGDGVTFGQVNLTYCEVFGVFSASQEALGSAAYSTIHNVQTSSGAWIVISKCLVTGGSTVTDVSYASQISFKGSTILDSICVMQRGWVVIDSCILNVSTANAINCYGQTGNEAHVRARCSDFYGFTDASWIGGSFYIVDTSDVFFSDPLFCYPEASDYAIAEGSPCAPANNACGVLIGACDVGCVDPAELSIPTISACHTDQTIEVPVLVSNFVDVLGLQLRIGFDPLVIVPTSDTISSKYLSGVTIGGTSDRISMNWDGDLSNPLSIPDGDTLLTLLFQPVGSQDDVSPLEWDDAFCMLFDIVGNAMPLSTVDGSVTLDCEFTPPCEPCFAYTANTEDYYAIQIDEALMEGLALEVCDEIGVFDGDLCVGASTYEGTWPISLLAWEDDPQTPEVDGYTPGNVMTFQISRPPDCVPCPVDVDNPTYVAGDGTFGNGPYAQISSMDCAFTPPCEPCFAYTSNTEDYYAIQIDEALMEGLALEVCDEIGVFDGDLCVGAATYEGTWPISLLAWEDDPQTPEVDGYTPGNTMTFQISRPPDCVPCPVDVDNPTYVAGDGTFGNGPYAQISSMDCGFNPPCELTCFMFTDNTEDYYPIIIEAATLKDLPLQQCDEIGVFDGDLCVGAAIYEGSWPLSIKAWEDDQQTPEVDGYSAGNSIIFKISRPPDCEHCQVMTIEYTLGDGTFGSGPYCQVSNMNAECIVPVSLELNAGWNFVSLPITPDPSDPLLIFESVLSDITIIKSRDAFCVPYTICEIETWEHCQGYKIHMGTAHTVEIWGAPLACESPCHLSVGWSWIWGPPCCCIPVEDAVASLDPCVAIVKGMSGFYVPGVINSLGDMCPLEGYAIYSECEGDLIYPPCAKPPDPSPRLSSATRYRPAANLSCSIRTDDYHPLVLEFDDNIEKNSLVSVYTSSGLLVGTGLYEGSALSIMAWKDDPQTEEVDGWLEGESMEIRMSSSGNDNFITPSAAVTSGSLRFGQSAYTSLKIADGSSDETVLMNFLAHNRPNPFNPTTEIEFGIKSQTEVILEVFNVLGEKVETLIEGPLDAGTHTIVWNASEFPSGVYFYRLKTAGFQKTKKMLLLK